VKSSLEFSSVIDIYSVVTVLDWGVFFFILLATLAAVVVGQSRRRKLASKEELDFVDYLLMGRRLTLPLFVATLVATWYGGIFGVTRIAFEHGIYNFLTQGVFWYLSYLIFAFFIVKKVRAYEALTLPELVGKMFGPYSGKLAAVFNFFNVIPISYSIGLGLFSQALFGGGLLLNMTIGLSVVVGYSIFGGFRAVVFSDLVQFFVMCAAVFLVVVFSFWEFGGLSFLQQSLPATHFEWMGGLGFGETFIWGFIALATLVDPNFYQRCFAATSTRTAKWGIIISTGVWVLFDICTTAGALYARALVPEADPGFAYLIYAVQILPDGFRGFFLAGVLATILSTIDSYFFIASSTIAYDLPSASKKRSVARMRISLIGVAILSLGMALIFDGNIKLVWKTLGTYFAACLLFPVIFGYCFPGKVRDSGFVTACLMGVIVVSVWNWWGLHSNVAALYPGLAVTSIAILMQVWRFPKTS
jgi:SSS family solute:Na+ symporter